MYEYTVDQTRLFSVGTETHQEKENSEFNLAVLR